MPMTRARSSRGFARAQRRLTAWALGPGADTIAGLDSQQFTASGTAVLGSGATPVIPQLTVVRLRGFVNFGLSAADALNSGFACFVGIGIATLDAFTVGSGSLPNPFDDQDWPGWLWLGNQDMRTAIGAIAIGDPSVNPVRIEVDSKAMRKLRQNEVIFMSAQVGESGVSTVDVRGFTRMLVKLP